MSAVLAAEDFVACLRAHGVRRVAGVPCGHLAGPWTLLDTDGDLVAAASEGGALATAAGWELAGTRSAVFCQNSGFGNLLNPLTSLVLPYRIPVLVVMSLRGWPDPADDEAQHAVMGATSLPVLAALDVPHTVVRPDTVDDALRDADRARAEGRPFFLLVPRGTIGKTAVAPPVAALPPRSAAVSAVMSRLSDELLVTTTGYLSRQAHHERDRKRTFYMQGSMGHAAAIGLGLATAQPRQRVVVLDGDGAFLMHLGVGATIGTSGARNLVHLVVDNGCYESTGCQPSPSAAVDWRALGAGLGYRTVLVCDEEGGIGPGVEAALTAEGPVLCVLEVSPSPGEVHPRASAGMGLPEIACRFRTAAGSTLVTT